MKIKIKTNAVQFTILTKNQISLFLRNYKFIILSVSIILLSLLFNILGLSFLNFDFKPKEKLIIVNLLVMLTSIFLIIQTIYLTVNCFISQIKNNIHTTELRYGYKSKNIFLSRIIFTIGYSFAYLLIMFLISSIFFGIAKGQSIYHDIYIYRLYISAFGWYAILIFLTIVVTVVLSRFLAESATSIIASILGIFFILIPAIIGFTSSWVFNNRDSNDGYLFLLTEDYKRKLYSDLNADEISKNIFLDFEYVSKYRDESGFTIPREKLLVGSKFWDIKDEDQEKIQNYYNLVLTASEILKNDTQITAWDYIQDFTDNLGREDPLNTIFDRLLENKEMKKYDYLLQIMKKYTNNFTILKSLNIVYQSSFDQNFKDQISSKYWNSPDEYVFVRTLNTLFLRLTYSSFEGEGMFSSSYGEITFDPVENAKKRVESDKIANIFNPLRHFNLMFQSIDYNNKFLFNIFGQNQTFYTNVANIDFDFTGDYWELDSSSITLKQNVPVEAIYVFYFALGSLLIWFSSLGFNKKIKH